MSRSPRAPFAVVLVSVIALAREPGDARADELVIKRPGAHLSYVVELEPQVALVLPSIYGRAGAPGVGGRLSLTIVSNGFVSSINNSIAIGTGVDVVFVDSSEAIVLVPIVLQWNFWLTKQWSVFGEPGLVLSNERDHVAWPSISAGGRFHFADRFALTLRVGAPTATLGLSFLL